MGSNSGKPQGSPRGEPWTWPPPAIHSVRSIVQQSGLQMDRAPLPFGNLEFVGPPSLFPSLLPVFLLVHIKTHTMSSV